MHPLILLPLIALVAICILMTFAFIWAEKLNNFSIVDTFWTINFALIAVFIFIHANGFILRKAIVCSLALIWSLRLCLHLSQRIFSHIKEEEGRYKQLRIDWAKHLNVKFFIFFQMQAFSNVLLALPFFIIGINTNEQMCWLEYVGAAIWLISIVGEAVADWQLKNFKQNAANKGKVCEAGLWNYSRHPNYFFQLMLWIGVFIFAINSPFGWWAIISPLSIGYLLFKVTGIPMTEEQALKSKPAAYKKYQQTTSMFIPWFKKLEM